VKLVALEMHGFKSFADSTEIRFHDGITAIVGPNGCGKSNISDALRWVLGEQRPTAIRGTRMEEAIFQGTERRKPIHRAEVTLVLSNEDGRLPAPYAEVRIQRTLYRGGESEYALNGTPCRLRDILDLCRDTGLGTNAYSVIEGRMVDAILSDRAEERRALFEEAAGIGRYKERRRVASRRLDEAEQDLARLNDVISEVEAKVRSLAQQRGRARRHTELRRRKLTLELALADLELDALAERARALESELARLRDAEAGDQSALHAAEAELERWRTNALALEERRAQAGAAAQACRDRIAHHEQVRALAEERTRNGRLRLDQIARESEAIRHRRAELAAEVERLRAQVAEAAARLGAHRHALAEAEQTLAQWEARRRAVEGRRQELDAARRARAERAAALRGERAALEARWRELAAALDALEAERRTLEREGEEVAQRFAGAERGLAEATAASARVAAELERARADAEAARERERTARARGTAIAGRRALAEARLEELEAGERAGEDLDPATRALLAAQPPVPGVRGLLADALRAPEALVPAIEALLGDYAEAVLVDDAAAVDAVRRWFRTRYRGPGGLCLLPLDAVRDEPPELPPPLRAEGPGAPWLARILRGIRVVDGEVRPGEPALSGLGESVDRWGAVRLGRTGAAGRRLARRAEADRIRASLVELQTEAAAAEAEAQRAADSAAAAEERVRALEAEAHARATETSRLEGERRALELRRADLARERETWTERRQGLERERLRIRHRLDEVERELGTLEEKPDAAPATDAERPADADDVFAGWEAAHERVTELRVEDARLQAEWSARTHELAAAERGLEDLGTRETRLAHERAEHERAVAAALAESAAAAERLEALLRERQEAESALARLDEEIAALRSRIAEREAQLRQAQRALREQGERRHALELQRSEIENARTRIRERIEAEWGRPLESLREEAPPPDEKEAADAETLRLELAEVNDRLHRLGPVNLLAEEEYREESERLQFLQAQRDDLVRARDDLRATIRRINETAVAAFLDTFERVRGNFQRTFATLFEGGECNLWLEDPQDPLESPIEISASPGGKRTQRIHLLSGGERALTALALLFAIYLVKPSPFCLLDEVDAPLDEANILRFVRMLEEFKAETQFIVITHNPRTIEAADWVYGVTMEEAGVSKVVGVELAGLRREDVA
jgi:chromosome segregation protein